MVTAAARSHIAATLVFAASVLLVARQRAGLVRRHRAGRGDVARARGRAAASRRRSASAGMRFLLGADHRGAGGRRGGRASAR